MNLGLPEIIAIVVLVVLLFGVGRISKISGELGSAVHNFRKGLKGDLEEDDEKKAEKKEDTDEGK